ncbi:hypothetical protein B7C42_08133 [Nocardia cerradoensis]|uniref:Uncharacterized protein n=1 Tax=Nocardia cerradoensis TaxID=85688 RepID=A0A231GT41_9NOCA|nr:hypothetical protein B7C42_08133 [Nocardia cerradoensis]
MRSAQICRQPRETRQQILGPPGRGPGAQLGDLHHVTRLILRRHCRDTPVGHRPVEIRQQLPQRGGIAAVPLGRRKSGHGHQHAGEKIRRPHFRQAFPREMRCLHLGHEGPHHSLQFGQYCRPGAPQAEYRALSALLVIGHECTDRSGQLHCHFIDQLHSRANRRRPTARRQRSCQREISGECVSARVVNVEVLNLTQLLFGEECFIQHFHRKLSEPRRPQIVVCDALPDGARRIVVAGDQIIPSAIIVGHRRAAQIG